MFESRLQTAQVCLFGAGIATIVGVFVLIGGPPVVGVFFLVVGNGLAAVGNGMYADMKGYPAYVGVALGIALGITGSIFLVILPDETEESPFEAERRMARRAVRKRRKKDPGYEVLDED